MLLNVNNVSLLDTTSLELGAWLHKQCAVAPCSWSGPCGTWQQWAHTTWYSREEWTW